MVVKNEEKKLGDIVLIIIISISFIMCPIFFFMHDGKPLSSFFASFSLSCIVYRFLGGIGDNSKISIGIFKLTGSAAFIIGCIWFLNNFIFIESNNSIVYMPGLRWYPTLIANGNPDSVIIKTNSDSIIVLGIDEIAKKQIKDNKYEVEKDTQFIGRYYISKGGYKLGYIELPQINNMMGKQIKGVYEPDIFTLHPFLTQKNIFQKSKKYPFKVVATNGEIDILDIKANTPICDECSAIEPIKKKQRIITYKGLTYLIFILQANHTFEDKGKWYSKFLIGRLIYE